MRNWLLQRSLQFYFARHLEKYRRDTERAHARRPEATRSQGISGGLDGK